MANYKQELQDFFKFCPHCATPFELRAHEESKELVCPHCGYTHWLNSKPTVSALIINSEDEVLLAKRAIDPLKGGWDIPGGFLELYETPEEGVRREIKEELGIGLPHVIMLPCQFVGTYETTPIQITFNTYALTRISKTTSFTPQDDVQSVHWVPIKGVPENIAFENNKHALAYLQAHYEELKTKV